MRVKKKAPAQRYTAEVAARVRELGVLGTTWEEMGPLVGRTFEGVRQIWTRFATEEEKEVRFALRQKAMRAAQAATYQQRRDERMAASEAKVTLPEWVRFEDDPRAIAECGVPKFMPHNYAEYHSYMGSTAELCTSSRMAGV